MQVVYALILGLKKMSESNDVACQQIPLVVALCQLPEFIKREMSGGVHKKVAGDAQLSLFFEHLEDKTGRVIAKYFTEPNKAAPP